MSRETTSPEWAHLNEDDLDNLNGLSYAIEVCSDVIMGLVDPETARRALPRLVILQRAELEKLYGKVEPNLPGDVQ